MKVLRRLVFVPLLLVLFARTGFGWGYATHVYFSKQLGVQGGHLNYNEMYGSMITDAFNQIRDEKGLFMDNALHSATFMLFVQQARTCGQKASAFGVASHNDVWGANWTAHHNSFTFVGEGYAIVKGGMLALSIASALVPILMNADPPVFSEEDAKDIADLIAPAFGHDLSEAAVDFHLRSIAPSVGEDILQAARRRSSDVGQLLASAYAPFLSAYLDIRLKQAQKFIMDAERGFNDEVIQYGEIMMAPDEEAIGALAYAYATAAKLSIEAFIKANLGIDVVVTVDPIVVGEKLAEAMTVVFPDFESEVTQTLAYLGTELPSQGITTCESPALAKNNPLTTLLSDNFPNPFNPSTTMSYELPELSHVVLKVFNSLGQEVATLVDGIQEPGYKSVHFNASGLPSGVYFYRLQAGDFISTKNMLLLK